jgi:hypothetical protein
VGGDETGQARGAAGARRLWYLLLILPFLGTLFPQIYDSARPALGGLPFFYWYQLAWVVVGALLTAAAYLLTR